MTPKSRPSRKSPSRRRGAGLQGKKRAKRSDASTPSPPSAPEEVQELQGPPPREATLIRSDLERRAAERLAEHTETGPELSGGDVDADWERAASSGEEAVGGTVATPDQNVVDELGRALGVPRAPDEALRASAEILKARDRRRWEQEA